MSEEHTTSDVLRSARRIIVKVGSTLVTNEGRGLDAAAVGEWCRQLALLEAGSGSERREVVMVSSGAIAEGMKRLGWATRPSAVSELQAAAAVGQMGLAQMYETQLRAHGLRSAQVLLTHADLADRERYLNARATLLTLLEHRVLPVINENDSVITDEIKVGDNDTLGALVANLIEADLLVILTDQKGLFDADPRTNPDAKLISEAHAGNPALEEMAGGAGSAIGRGGMLTKVLAARRAAGSGASTVIAWGREPDVLLRLAAGERIGTLLVAPQHKTQARKQWIADHLQVSGALTVDDGAAAHLRRSGASLLPVGVISVHGNFVRGDAIAIRDAAGVEIARGLVNYSSSEAKRLLRQPSSKIAEILGYTAEAEMVHRDNLALSH